MRVLVLGAGVVGITTAYYLSKSGCEVTVLDRQPGPGLETSFANAGEISPGYASPWAGPGMPLKAVRWMLDPGGPLVMRPQTDIAMWRWLALMLKNCTAARYALNKARMVAVAEYSRDCLRALRLETGIRYDDRSRGMLQLFRKQSQLDAIGKDVDVLRQYDVPLEILNRSGCVLAEPGLASARASFVGGLRLPDDETGDCYLFTSRLEAIAASMGVRFIYNTSIESIQIGEGRVTGVTTGSGAFTAESYVVALGSFSPLLLRPINIDIPVYPVKGYSVTVPIVDDSIAPQSTIMDETYKVAITRLGDRIRVGGTAEISDYKVRLNTRRRKVLDRSLSDLFPHSGDLSQSTFWSGLRPMTPDGPPIIGPARYNNLYLNTGHGTLGWTMACGAARIVTDQIVGTKPEIAANEFSFSRYQ